MHSLISKYQALDTRSKRLLRRAFRALFIAQVTLILRPFNKLVAGLDIHDSVIVGPPLDAERLDVANRVGWAVRTAVRYIPWGSSCLVQVLAAQRMLQKQGVAGVIYLGVDKKSTSAAAGAFVAHAWLKCGNHFITGEAGHECYVVVSSFSWS